MPCDHKFIKDLTLDYVNWEVRTLFIGTFNPSWEGSNNNSNWFYGRSKNSFWCILPKIYNSKSLIKKPKKELIDFCRKNHLAITDIITSLNNAEENNPDHKSMILKFNDGDLNLFAFTLTDLKSILDKFKTIKQVCFTAISFPYSLQFEVERIEDWMNALPDRNISIRHLYSPNNQARKGIPGPLCTGKAQRWMQQGFIKL